MPERGRRESAGPSRESSTHRLSVPRPEEVGLPRAKRNYVLPILIALAVFALIVVMRFVWG